MNGFGAIRQVAHVVTDMDQATAYWTARLGVGPFFLIPEIEFPEFSYRGKATVSPRVAIAIAFSGGVQIELIQQFDETPSIYTEFLAAGRSGTHHYSSWDASREAFEARRAWALAAGFSAVQESRPEAGVRFAYFETGDPAAPYFEMAEALVPALAERMKAMEQICRDWDGRDPLRPISYGQPA